MPKPLSLVFPLEESIVLLLYYSSLKYNEVGVLRGEYFYCSLFIPHLSSGLLPSKSNIDFLFVRVSSVSLYVSFFHMFW